MKAVILAAGRGDRLKPLTNDRPKALVSVRGKPLIDYTLEFLSHHPFSEIVVVGGAFFPLLEKHLADHSAPLRLVENRDFDQGNLLSLAAAAPHVNEEFLLMNADHIYPRKLLPALLETAVGITAVCDFNRTLGDDDMKVRLGPARHLRQISKRLAPSDGGYIGMTWCGYDRLKAYHHAVQATLKRRGRLAVVEEVLQTLADQNEAVPIFDASPFRWFEIDTPEELRQTELILAQG